MGWNLDSRFTIGHGAPVNPVQTVRGPHIWTCDCVTGEKSNSLQGFQHLLKTAGRAQVLGSPLARAAHVSHLTTHTRLTRHLTFLPARLHAGQTHITTRWYRAVTLVIQRAASSYNNIALWRSPERTGKCRLCAQTGEGWRWARGLFVQPQQQRALGWKGEAEKGRERGSGGGVQRGHLQVSPLGLTRCESLPEGG